VYRKLYEEGVCIVEDFFEDPAQEADLDSDYPPPLFACTDAQANYVTRPGISRDAIFDGARRSTYETNKKKIAGPGPRQQLKPCKVVTQLQPYLFYKHSYM
jgi:hypothetical protein